MDIKREVIARVAKTVREDAVVSTNTSGLPIHQIAEGLPEQFKTYVFWGRTFLILRRYLKLLEIIPTPDTDPADCIASVAHFGRLHLGKGIVIARDTPNFIGNRIGIFGMMHAMRAFTDGVLTVSKKLMP